MGLAVLGVLLLPVIATGHGTSGESLSSAVLVPGAPPVFNAAQSCTYACSATTLGADRIAGRVSPPAAPTEAPTTGPTPVPTSTPEPLPTMEVRPGDTLVALANWFGVSPFDIASVNGVAVDDYLQIGEVLAIPVSAASFSMPPDPNAYVAAAPTAEPAAAALEPAAAPPPPQPTPTPYVAPYVPPAAGDVVAIICSLPWPCDQMVRIATCESGLNPHSMNPAGYYGLFQISNHIDGWEDALTNATFAYQNKYLPALARGDGLTPWPVCRSY